LAVNVGSRDDAPGFEGLAHFVEHTIFKGTGRRKAGHIINRMESCGGELNAYTTKETTVIYSIFPAGNSSRAADLIADLVINSRFPTKEIDREREVVADEICSYLDIPSESIYDDFEDLIFASSGLGHNILGSTGSLALFNSDICRRYLSDFYVAQNMVLFYSGPATPDAVWRIAERHFSAISSATPPTHRVTPPLTPTFTRQRDIHIHQSHTIIGTRIPDMFSPQRHAMALLVNILGGPGMNSMLNVQLREKRGLVYSVDCTTAMFTDCGLFSIYFGCDPEDHNRCRRIIDSVLKRLIETPLTPRQLEKAKAQYLGQLTVASDNRESSILAIARAVLYHGCPYTTSQRARIIHDITEADIAEAASMLAPEKLSSLSFR